MALLLIEGGAFPPKRYIYEELNRLGQDFVVVGATYPEYLRDLIEPRPFIQADIYNPIQLVPIVTTRIIQGRIRVDGVGTFHEHAVHAMSTLASVLGLPGPAPAAVFRASNNKPFMKHVLREAGFPYLARAERLIEHLTPETLAEGVDSLSGPAVLKPIFGCHSKGVSKVNSPERADVQAALQEIDATWSPASEAVFSLFPGTYLLEEYMPGRMVSVDGIVQGGTVHVAGMVEILMSDEPRFIQVCNVFPPRVDAMTVERAIERCKEIVRLLQFDDCAFHCELRLVGNEPHLVEIACRAPGGHIMKGYEHHAGFHFIEQARNLWCGRPVGFARTRARAVAQKGVYATRTGRLRSVVVPSEVRDLPGIFDFVVVLQQGDVIDTLPARVPLYVYSLEANSMAEIEEIGRIVEKEVVVEFES